MNRERIRPLLVLLLLFSINVMNFFDRQILAAVTEPLRKEWKLSDTQIGWLGTAFILLYAVVGLPLGRFADIWQRKWLLALGLAFWSAMTSGCGLCRGFWSFFAMRLGIGVGEAACAPAATSIIGDLFSPNERGRALSIFMLGLPVGIALSYLVSGAIAQSHGWRAAFYVAGMPGLVLALLCAFLREPERGQVELSNIGTARRPGSPIRLLLGIPTMWWIIVSGALHNFNMYAIGTFLPAFLIRYHRVTIRSAGLICGIVIGSVGAIGMLLGGWLGDVMVRYRASGRMLVASGALLISVPAFFLALSQPPGAITSFMLFQGIACMLMYVYYTAAYSTIQDILEPSLRGRGMALYFFAMYALGAFLGPVATGWTSDFFARRASPAANLLLTGSAMIPDRSLAIGLHRAMYLIPILGIVLTAVLFAGSATVGKDVARLREWMRRVQSEGGTR